MHTLHLHLNIFIFGNIHIGQMISKMNVIQAKNKYVVYKSENMLYIKVKCRSIHHYEKTVQKYAFIQFFNENFDNQKL